MFWKRKVAQLTREQSLNARVLPNSSLRTRENEGGIITLVVPFHAPGWIRRLARRVGSGEGERTVELDQIGSFVWRMCDGETAVRDMIERLADEYKVNRKEAEASVTAFLRTLATRGLVMIVVRRDANEGGGLP
jgi:hypothetical protein